MMLKTQKIFCKYFTYFNLNNLKKILIYNSGGGLGDSIQLFDLITSLKKGQQKE